MKYQVTNHGVQFGPALVEALCSDDAKGWILLRLKTGKTTIEVYVTKTGKIRFYQPNGGELHLVPKETR